MAAAASSAWHVMSTLDACILIEETCAAIYYSFAGMFADDKVSARWTEMALEEENHADQFRTVRALHQDSHQGFEGENYLIKTMLDHVTALSEGIGQKPLTLKDALLTALILEKSVEKYHLETSQRIVDPELANLLTVMVEYSRGHIDILQLAVDAIDTSS
jgi:rubrerythrin